MDGMAPTQEIMIACLNINGQLFFLKLDLAKAFDTLVWDFLLRVLQARGFDARLCGQISSLLNSGFSSVLINDQPGTPFRRKHGLRQGDSLLLCISLL